MVPFLSVLPSQSIKNYVNNLDLNDRLKKIATLLNKYLPLLSQSDLDVIQGKRVDHKWTNALLELNSSELTRFDAFREHTLLQDSEWLQLTSDIEELSRFKRSAKNQNEVKAFGNIKKQHELNQLYSFLDHDRGRSIVDFGGGVGNLAYFLEGHLSMDVTVLEKDLALVEKGRSKLKKLNSRVNFTHCHVSNDEAGPNISNSELAIGLHTCGNFATDMFRICIDNRMKKIINFGCCYSKIKDNDYNLSSASDSSLHLNQRALSSATQSFNCVPVEFYEYRKKIMNYKFSFYHWLFKSYDHLGFCSMSNARNSLYKNKFSDYLEICLKKYFPEIATPGKEIVQQFYESEANKNLNDYLSVFYAIQRYLGKLVELYILCDRALFLQEKNYCVEIVEVFDPSISPRSCAIVALKN